MRTLFLVAVLVGCNEPALVSSDAPPTVSVLAPAEGENLDAELLELVGVARDDGGATSLTVTWSTADGLVGEASADTQGNTYLRVPLSELGEGKVVIMLEAMDGVGQTAKVAVGVTLGAASTSCSRPRWRG